MHTTASLHSHTCMHAHIFIHWHNYSNCGSLEGGGDHEESREKEDALHSTWLMSQMFSSQIVAVEWRGISLDLTEKNKLLFY